MIRPSGDVRIHLYRHPVDMRRAINGLVAMFEGELELDPFSADLFIFCNRSRNLVKMITWEGNGFILPRISTHEWSTLPGILRQIRSFLDVGSGKIR